MALNHKMVPDLQRLNGSKKARVAHLTSVHSPFDIRIFQKECVSLGQAGYDVVLIAPHKHDEVKKGVRIRAIPRPTNRRQRMLRTTWHAFKAAINESVDVVHFHDPELIPVGLLLKLRGKRVIYDVHENVPDHVKSYAPAVFQPLIGWLAQLTEHVAWMCFDGVVAATGTIAKRFPTRKTITVQNFPIPDELVSNNGHVPYHQRGPLIAYVGGINLIRGLKQMLRGLSMIPKTVGVRLAIAGSFDSPELEREAKEMPGWEQVEFLGWRSREELATLLGHARMGLVLYHPVPVHAGAQPNKLFEYMSAGIPLVASDFPLWREIVEGTQCGLVVDPLNPDAIAKAIQWLLEHPAEAEAMGRRGRQAVGSSFNWDREALKLIDLYRRFFSDEIHNAEVLRCHS